MIALVLHDLESVRQARVLVRQLAEAAGVADPDAAQLVAGELGNNVVQYGSADSPGLVWIGCRPHSLTLQFENRCVERPSWRTRKPAVVEGFSTGGYGLVLAQRLANLVSRRWWNGRVIVRATFH